MGEGRLNNTRSYGLDILGRAREDTAGARDVVCLGLQSNQEQYPARKGHFDTGEQWGREQCFESTGRDTRTAYGDRRRELQQQ